jgi:hypothetical protein
MGFLSNLFGKKQGRAEIDQVVDERSGDTKLHEACEHGAVEEVRNLLKQGAAVNITNKFGATPLDLAYANGVGSKHWRIFAEIAQLLKSKGGKTRKWTGATF